MKENPPSEEFGSRRFDGISYAPSCCSSPRKMKLLVEELKLLLTETANYGVVIWETEFPFVVEESRNAFALVEYNRIFELPKGIPPERPADYAVGQINVKFYKLISEMLASMVIRPRTNLFSSPVLLVKVVLRDFV
ncbi:hypothetical protein SDJN02_23136, partial [Cucurbita argyrosperma subsp. argyrosperma]